MHLAHAQFSDWLMEKQQGDVSGISIINSLVSTSLESVCWWAVPYSHPEGLSISAKQLKDTLVCIDGEPRPCPKAVLLFLLTVSPWICA